MKNNYLRMLVGLFLAMFLTQGLFNNNASAQSSSFTSNDYASATGFNPTFGKVGYFSLGYMGGERSLTAGYTGLVRPGTCVSSYFVYDLKGILASCWLPTVEWKGFSARLGGSYLFSFSVPADQEITWLYMPTGIRSWNWAKSSFFKLEGELLYPVDESCSFITGIRWESLSTSFGDPDPSYPFTISSMESGLGIGVYQPYVGASVQQKLGRNLLSLRLIGFPVMLATLEHFNTCNNNGEPFAHVGRQDIRSGYFVEASAEIISSGIAGIEVGAFVNWELYRGTCIMNLERRDMGPPETATAADVDFVYNRSSFTIGANAAIPFGLPF